MSDHDTIVRNGSSQDVDQVGSLTLRAYREFESYVSSEFARAFLEDALRVQSAPSGAQLIVAERDGRLVGCVSLYLDGSAYAEGWPPEWPAVRLLAVDPAERGRGIAKLLMKECIARARRHGAGTIGLHTTPFMVAAQRLYEGMGFRREPTIDFQYSPEVEVMGYLLRL